MKHYVVLFVRSKMVPGTWLKEHFVRGSAWENIPPLPESLEKTPFEAAVKMLEIWQNVPPPDPSWTLEECFLGDVALFTVFLYDESGVPETLYEYTRSPARLLPE